MIRRGAQLGFTAAMGAMLCGMAINWFLSNHVEASGRRPIAVAIQGIVGAVALIWASYRINVESNAESARSAE